MKAGPHKVQSIDAGDIGPGDVISMEQMYRDQSGSLVSQIAHRTGCRDTAQDLVQDAFVRLLGMGSSRLGRIHRPESFLHRVSSNLTKDWGRKRAVRQRFDALADKDVDLIGDTFAALETRDTLRRLERAIDRMKPNTREIFLAHRLDGLSYKEIAARTGLSVKGVEKQMSRAIAKIDRFLDRD